MLIGIILSFIGLVHLIIIFLLYPIFIKKKSSLQHYNTPSEKKTIFNKSISIIIPFYNELNIIPDKLKSIIIPDEFINNIDIIFVNDGCKNITSDEMKILISNNKKKYKISSIKLSKQYGKTFAQFVGSSFSKADYLILSDCNAIFDTEYFTLLFQFLSNDEKLFGGILSYHLNYSGEEKYWKFETILKLAEQDANFFNTGMFGSNIIISRSLYQSYPYYSFCDFSLPLHYQSEMKTPLKILKPELLVYEHSSDCNYDLYKTKKRIAHRALFGLKKTFALSSNIPPLLIFQLYFHKIARWLGFIWILCIVCGFYLIFYNSFIIYSKIILLIFGCGLIIIFSVSKLRNLLLYPIIALAAAIAGFLNFCIKPTLHCWTPTKK